MDISTHAEKIQRLRNLFHEAVRDMDRKTRGEMYELLEAVEKVFLADHEDQNIRNAALAGSLIRNLEAERDGNEEVIRRLRYDVTKALENL